MGMSFVPQRQSESDASAELTGLRWAQRLSSQAQVTPIYRSLGATTPPTWRTSELWQPTDTDIALGEPFTLPIHFSDSDAVSGLPQSFSPLDFSPIAAADAEDHGFVDNFGPDDTEFGTWENPPPMLYQSTSFIDVLRIYVADWFLIQVDAVSIFTYYLCATDCAPGPTTSTVVTRSINQAIEVVRRLQPQEEWDLPDITIQVRGRTCHTKLTDHFFQTALRAEVSIARDMLFELAYLATRKLLVPCHHQVEQFEYPYIVFLGGLDDAETISSWRASGCLTWDKQQGYPFFHFYIAAILESNTTSAEFLYHLFCNTASIGFIHVYQHKRDHSGIDKWVTLTHATDEMLAFALGWIVAVVDADVLQNKRFTDNIVTKRRRDHFLAIHRRLLGWFRRLRAGESITGLSPKARTQALQALDMLAELSLPDLSLYFGVQ
ncbi:hypothetical protein JVT61DRAFT_10871 [Boletus reticuloceps]|uniref:Uncharacterized protein n=1 Tax=Boletus reticuloceps TaxID=495285 RepID=A0A8I3A3W0_9AGAM|nr:hypothetical protein JVT61DRAFT_10871 [Boletus reticuloceps]